MSITSTGKRKKTNASSNTSAVPSLLHLRDIVYGARRVPLVQQKVSLHQGGADLRVGGQGALRKPLAVGRRLVRVEAAEHLRELLARAVADVLLQVYAARSDQGGVQPVWEGTTCGNVE